MRFCNAGALATRNANVDYVTNLDNEGFTPDNVWLATELRGGGATAGSGIEGQDTPRKTPVSSTRQRRRRP
jgi:hypothetical protein